MLRSAIVVCLSTVSLMTTYGCNKSSSSSDEAPAPTPTSVASVPPAPPIYLVEGMDVTSLQVDSRQQRDGDLTNAVAVQVNFPIHIAFGITQTGGTADTQIAFGLMQQLTPEEAAAANGTQRHCFLGSTGAHHPGDGKEMHYDATFVVPPECAATNESTTYNLYVGIDVPGEVKEATAEDDGNVVIYNQDLLEETRNQKCKLTDGTVGCILSVTVNPSPGVNLSFASMETESSVAILEPLDEHTGGVDDNGSPVVEVHSPFAKAISTLTLSGVNTDDTSALSDKNTVIKYDVCPEGQFHDSCAGSGWMPLTISSAENSNARSGHDSSLAVPSLVTGEPKIYSTFLYAEGATYTAMISGEWAQEEKFMIRGCVSSDVEEKIAGSADNSLALLDNCQTQLVAIVRSPANPGKAYASYNKLDDTTNSYTVAEDFSLRAGSHKTIRVDTKLQTENVLNLDGAFSRNSLEVALAGKVTIKAVQTIGKAAAYVSVVGSYVDIQHSMLNVGLYSLNKQIADEFTYEKEYAIVREACAQFNYNMLVIVLKGSMCVGGKAGFQGIFNVKAIEGGEAPFTAAQRTGIVTVTFGPIATVGARTNVSGGNEAARGGIKGNLRLIEATFPTVASLQWGLTSLSPTVLDMKIKVKSSLELAILDGEIVAYADLREVDMCDRSWKVCGHRFHAHYPCGFKWERKVDENLVSFTGDTRKLKLLSRQMTMTLQ